MNARQALAWVEKHEAVVVRGATEPRTWLVSLLHGNFKGSGTTLVEAVEKARGAITKRFDVRFDACPFECAGGCDACARNVRIVRKVRR